MVNKEDLEKIREVIREEVTRVSTDTLTPDKASEVLGVQVGTLAVWRSRGKGPKYFKSGGTVMYRASDVAEYINSRVVKP